MNAIEEVLDRVQAQNESLKYLCDPVLGDNGKLYAPAELVGLYKEKIIPRAYIVTPNQFEAELLVDAKIVD